MCYKKILFLMEVFMKPLKGKVALVTGGGSGIGFAITKALLDEGMGGAICGRDEGKLRKAETELWKHGGKLLVMPADVSKKSGVDHWVKAAVSQFGRIDVLVNNAGVAL